MHVHHSVFVESRNFADQALPLLFFPGAKVNKSMYAREGESLGMRLHFHPCVFFSCLAIIQYTELATQSGAVLGKALGGSSQAHKCRDHAPYFAHARSAVRAFAMRMLIDIVGVVVIERARV